LAQSFAEGVGDQRALSFNGAEEVQAVDNWQS